MAEIKPNWRVFDRDSTNTCRISNLKVGRETVTNTAQSMYWSCCDMIRTQILNFSKKCLLLWSRFCVEICWKGSVRGWNWTLNWPWNLDRLLTLVVSSWDWRTMWTYAAKIWYHANYTFQGIQKEFVTRRWEEMIWNPAMRKYTNCMDPGNLGKRLWDQMLRKLQKLSWKLSRLTSMQS